jgi:hypothetical protein
VAAASLAGLQQWLAQHSVYGYRQQQKGVLAPVSLCIKKSTASPSRLVCAQRDGSGRSCCFAGTSSACSKHWLCLCRRRSDTACAVLICRRYMQQLLQRLHTSLQQATSACALLLPCRAMVELHKALDENAVSRSPLLDGHQTRDEVRIGSHTQLRTATTAATACVHSLSGSWPVCMRSSASWDSRHRSCLG